MSKSNIILKEYLIKIAELQNEISELKSKIEEEFDSCERWEIISIHKNCKEINGNLIDGNSILATGGLNDGKYYCNQHTGYVEDDFYGEMYYKIDDSTFVEIEYSC